VLRSFGRNVAAIPLPCHRRATAVQPPCRCHSVQLPCRSRSFPDRATTVQPPCHRSAAAVPLQCHCFSAPVPPPCHRRTTAFAVPLPCCRVSPVDLPLGSAAELCLSIIAFSDYTLTHGGTVLPGSPFWLCHSAAPFPHWPCRWTQPQGCPSVTVFPNRALTSGRALRLGSNAGL
jgi:hypothetical protein